MEVATGVWPVAFVEGAGRAFSARIAMIERSNTRLSDRTSRRGLLAGAAALALACGAVLAGFGPAPAADPIKVGHYGSMTGAEATFGQSTDKGIRLAIEEINAKGGINGRPIELITYDTKGDSGEAGKAVTRLISSDKVVAVIGEVASSLSLAGGAVCQQYGVPMISPSSTNPRVTMGRDFVFRVCFTDDFQAFALAKFVKENLKLTKVAILYDQKQAYSKGLRDEFTKSFTRMSGTIVIDQAYSGGDQDFSAQLAAIASANPEILLVPGYYTDGAAIAIQARKKGIKVPMLGGDGWDSEQLGKIAGDAIVGSYYSNHSAPDQPDMKDFVEKYRKKYDGQMPDALGGLGYDAANLLAQSMTTAKSLDGKDIRDAIAGTTNFPGVTGNISIDKNRNASKAAVIVQMAKNDKGEVAPKFVASVAPEKEAPKK
jgi:branched-chain amino acid transport system substrate-binding protein